MKRKNNLYKEIVSYQRTKEIFLEISKRIRNKRKLQEFLNFRECNIIELVEKLYNHIYVFDKYNIFIIKEPKYRIIMSENLCDKIVNHLISKYILLPCLEPCLIDTNVATRINKGSKYAIDSLCKYIDRLGTNNQIYALKIDISKYFYNIDHEILKKQIRTKIKDEKALALIDQLIDTTNMSYINDKIQTIKDRTIKSILKRNISEKDKKNLINEINKIPLYQYKKGLPIGNMTSQIMAVFYMNSVDHYIKENLICKYYIRYMDDLVILDSDKKTLLKKRDLIIREINKLNLNVNRKTNIYQLSHGFTFLGYRFKTYHNKLYIYYHNPTIHRINRKLRHLKEFDYSKYLKSSSSYYGYFKLCNTKLYYCNLINVHPNNLKERYYLLKEQFENYLIIIRKKDKYYSFDSDVIKIKEIFEWNSDNDKVMLKKYEYNKLQNYLVSNKLSYLLCFGNDIMCQIYKNN